MANRAAGSHRGSERSKDAEEGSTHLYIGGHSILRARQYILRKNPHISYFEGPY